MTIRASGLLIQGPILGTFCPGTFCPGTIPIGTFFSGDVPVTLLGTPVVECKSSRDHHIQPMVSFKSRFHDCWPSFLREQAGSAYAMLKFQLII
jgi:hypothetical protein